MDISARWAELVGALHQRRLVWAIETYDRFLADLAPDIRVRLTSARPRVDVALYGQTRVGKTTLLLTLLGVRPDRIKAVADTLKAGRRAGQSSTPTATRYQAAEGEQWTWRTGTEVESQPLSEPEVRSRIAAVREAVENNRWVLENVIEIGIPASYFTEFAGPRMRIIDLPGVDAANAVESSHARHLIDTWVTAADVVIMVSLVGRLGPLQPDALRIDALRHWHRQLGKFRVVLTYTYTDTTTTDWMKATAAEERTVRALRGEIRKDFDTFDTFDSLAWPGLDRTDLAWLYPLEFAGSWDALIADAPTHPARALRDETLALLRSDLALAVRPEARLRRAFQARDVACSVGKERRAALDTAVAEADRALAVGHQQRQDRLRLARRYEADIRALEDTRDSVNCLGEPRLAMVPLPEDVSSQGDPKMIGDAERALHDAFREACAEWQDGARKVQQSLPCTIGSLVGVEIGVAGWEQKADAIIDESFRTVRNTSTAWFAGTKERISARFRRRVRVLIRAAYGQAVEQLQKMLAHSARSFIEALGHVLDEARDVYKARLRRTNVGLAAADRAVENATAVAEQRHAWRARELAALAEHERVAGDFPARLEQQYQQRQAALMHEVAAATDTVQRLAASLAVMQCALVYDMIRYGDEAREHR